MVFSLASLGTIAPGESKALGGSLSFNNDGDTIMLFGPGNEQGDIFSYANSSTGVPIETGH